MSTLLTLVILAAAIGAYWTPTIIAARRHTRRLAQIAVINGLTGWSVVGWVIALAMAFEPAPAIQHRDVYLPPLAEPGDSTQRQIGQP